MEKKLYVGNLSYTVTSEGLSSHFAQCGTVDSVRIITDRDTGRSKGFGFVEMSNADEAAMAIEKFHNQEFEGRRLVVNEAKPQAPRENNNNRGGGSRNNRW